MSLAACTIVAKNYIAYARVLAQSFRKQQPDGRFYVLLVDRNEGYIDAAAEPFELLEAEELPNVPELRSFLFKYKLLEATTAIKPFLLAHLFERDQLDNLVYFDPDILITGSLDELERLLQPGEDGNNVVVTPHLTAPIDDGHHPSEQTILQAGSYNLGFIGLRRSAETDRLLAWWGDRLEDKCRVRIDEGLFVDQKWIDLVPGLYEGVHIHRHPGWNTAYWNLHGRKIELAEGADPARATANGEPLIFFHFSGIQPHSLEHVSKYQDRFQLADLGGAATLYRHYRDLVLAAGFDEAFPWPYAYGSFSNGVKIPDAAREIYSGLGDQRRRFGDPFEADGPSSFFTWLDAPYLDAAGSATYLTRLQARLHAGRPDLVRIFPDPAGADFPDFSAWLEGYGRHEMKLPDAYLHHLHRESAASRWSPAGLKRRARNRLKRFYHSDAGAALRRSSKRLFGPARYARLKRKLRPEEAEAALASVHPLGAYKPPIPENPGPFGVNLVGYLTAETGMGEAARGLARALERAGIPTTHHDLELGVLARREDPGVGDPAMPQDFRYGINLIVANADQAVPIFEYLGAATFAGRYNVGFWLWELESFPERWRGSFDLFHEIWTPSSFCVEAISEIAPVPVRKVPLVVEPEGEPEHDRSHFDLPSDAFVVLFMFNFLSYMERKNPLALVRAFRRAFAREEKAVLVLKTSQSDFAPEALAMLQKEIGRANVRVIDQYLSRGEVRSLVAACDCYASLHRSEGFGLTLAEAMAHGKPVVATPYSGNVDFFDLNNGFPVRYGLVEIAQDAGPYPAGARWAEPDEEHAAELLRMIHDRRAAVSAKRARRDIRAKLGVDAVAEIVGRRVREIVGRCGGGRVLE